MTKPTGLCGSQRISLDEVCVAGTHNRVHYLTHTVPCIHLTETLQTDCCRHRRLAGVIPDSLPAEKLSITPTVPTHAACMLTKGLTIEAGASKS